MRVTTDFKTLLIQLKNYGYEYYEDEGVIPTPVDEVLDWAGPLVDGESYYIEQYPREKKVDIFIIKNFNSHCYLCTVRKTIKEVQQ